jgi:hypothetical protein
MNVFAHYKKGIPSVQVKNKPRVWTLYMRLFLAHMSTQLRKEIRPISRTAAVLPAAVVYTCDTVIPVLDTYSSTSYISHLQHVTKSTCKKFWKQKMAKA